MLRTVLAGVALALTTSRLGAQITTYVAPPRPQAVDQTVAAADSLRRDSLATQAAITSMKAWVDSAAGVTVPVMVGDSVPAAEPKAPEPPVITTFEDGAVAPTTASSLPTLSALGILAMAIGAVLLAGRHR